MEKNFILFFICTYLNSFMDLDDIIYIWEQYCKDSKCLYYVHVMQGIKHLIHIQIDMCLKCLCTWFLNHVPSFKRPILSLGKAYQKWGFCLEISDCTGQNRRMCGDHCRTCGKPCRTCGAHSRMCGPCCKFLSAPFYVLNPPVFLKSVFDVLKMPVNSFEVKWSRKWTKKEKN